MYRFKHEHTLSRMAKVLKVSESGYFKWVKRQNTHTLRDIENIELEAEIINIFLESNAVFGARKITHKLNEERSVD
ncbi:MAG: transposase [Tissierellia bacterium]|nr:transposase [Tissierellia bacterium]